MQVLQEKLEKKILKSVNLSSGTNVFQMTIALSPMQLNILVFGRQKKVLLASFIIRRFDFVHEPCRVRSNPCTQTQQKPKTLI